MENDTLAQILSIIACLFRTRELSDFKPVTIDTFETVLTLPEMNPLHVDTLPAKQFANPDGNALCRRAEVQAHSLWNCHKLCTGPLLKTTLYDSKLVVNKLLIVMGRNLKKYL
ncbi:MAG: hypothetical protein ACR2OW_01345 [Methyloligellaceae bacterium]